MNTIAAAAQAQVSIPTIRTWCRNGVIAAVKQAGRWIIDTASLARRITIGAMKTARRTPKPVVYSIETMTAIGGNRWTKAGKDRVYLNHFLDYLPLETEYYKSGNLSWAAWNGERIANRQAGLLRSCVGNVWYDDADGKIHGQWGYGESRVASRQEVWDLIVAGIRADIAAL